MVNSNQTVHRDLLCKYYLPRMTRGTFLLLLVWSNKQPRAIPFTVYFSLLNGRLMLWLTDLSGCLCDHVTPQCSNGNIKSRRRISHHHKEHRVCALIISLFGCLGLLQTFKGSALFIYGWAAFTDKDPAGPEKWLHTITTNHFSKPQSCFTHQIPCFLTEADKPLNGMWHLHLRKKTKTQSSLSVLSPQICLSVDWLWSPYQL